MAITKAQKQKVLEDLEEKIAQQKAVVFIDFTGTRVKDLSSLRKKIKAEGNEMKVAKKTLFGMAFKKAGIEIDVKKMKGEIAAVFGIKDEISPAKMTYQFSLKNPTVKILGGLMENKLIDASIVTELAQIPSREQLLAKLVGSIASPISGFVNVLQGNIKGLVLALNGISKSK